MALHSAGRKIRPVRASDLPQISALIRNTLLVTNLRDYSLDTIRALMTPMELSSLEPGRYTIEIRSGAGFKPYQGRVTLGAGRTVTLDRELERELEVEDLLLLGKDSPQAHRSRHRGPPLPAARLGHELQRVRRRRSADSLHRGHARGGSLASFPEEGMFELQALKAAAEGGDVLAIWDYQRVRTRWIEDTMLFAWSFHTYATSIFDAWRTARQDFRYATYVELATGLSGVYCQRTQTEDSGSPVDPALTSAIYSGVGSFSYGSFVDAIFEGRKYLLLLGLSFNLGDSAGVFLELGYFYRYLEGERIMLGLGFDYLINYITTTLPASPGVGDLQAVPARTCSHRPCSYPTRPRSWRSTSSGARMRWPAATPTSSADPRSQWSTTTSTP